MKKGVIVLGVIGLILFLSVSFVSAGLLDDIGKWFKDVFSEKGITGRATDCGPNNQSACLTEGNCTTANGYWCSGSCQATSCSLSNCVEGLIPSSGCICQGINKYDGYCCYSYSSNGLVWTNVPCTQTCASEGGYCCLGTVTDCVGSWSGKWATDCQGYVCCIGTCKGTCYGSNCPALKTCSQQGGYLFTDKYNQICDGTTFIAPDGLCCPVPLKNRPSCSSNQLSACETQSNCTAANGYWCGGICQGIPCSNITNASTGSSTQTTPTTNPSTPTTTTSSSGSGGGSGGGGGSFVGGYYVPPSDTEYKSEKESTFIDEKGREVKIKTKTETKDGRTKIEETRTFKDEKGNKVEIKTDIEIESSEEGTEVKRKIKTKDGSEIIFKTKTEIEDGKENTKESISVKGAEFTTKLSVKEKYEEGETKLKARLSTGFEQEIIAKPDEALQTALNELGSTNNFVFELNEVGEGDEAKAVFVAKAEKPGRFLGIFNIQINLETLVDTVTGEIIETKKPWWSFLVFGTKKEDKATVCHVSEDGKKVNLEISVSAVKAHLAHGDSVGECV